jgi:hypothetical protein
MSHGAALHGLRGPFFPSYGLRRPLRLAPGGRSHWAPPFPAPSIPPRGTRFFFCMERKVLCTLAAGFIVIGLTAWLLYPRPPQRPRLTARQLWEGDKQQALMGPAIDP